MIENQDQNNNIRPYLQFMKQLETYLQTISDELPKYTKKESSELVSNLQKMIENLINDDINRAKNLGSIIDENTLRRLDDKIEKLRATEILTSFTRMVEKG